MVSGLYNVQFPINFVPYIMTMNRLSVFFASIILLYTANLHAQIRGKVSDANEPLIGVNISVMGTSAGAISDENGHFILEDLRTGKYRLLFSLIGYRSTELAVEVKPGETLTLEIVLKEDLIGLEGVVVSATRNEIPLHRAPVIVNVMDDRLFSMTQSLSLAEGLSFSPGLRLENNCQNCGFTQVRMNGLEGAYSQILINSRPVFSALAGVYGLEQIPANMIERVEVIRGAGSVLYGGNAIAGTINIITKDPVVNTFEASTTLGIINGVTPDWTNSVNASVVDEEMKTGISLYALNRQRDFFDANGDGFSEITRMNNTTFGMNAYYKPGKLSRLGLNLYHINEFRRGGDQFDVEPHFANVAEQLNHNIAGGGINYELSSKDLRSRLAIYGSAQKTRRNSYYGGGGGDAYQHLIENEVFAKGPETEADFEALETFQVALNSYGKSDDLSLSGGFQLSHNILSGLSAIVGTEVQSSRTKDEIPGYQRLIDQKVNTVGTYVQLEYRPWYNLSILAGGRYDRISVDGKYLLGNQFDQKQQNTFHVFVPRLSLMYSANDHWKLRGSFAQGYRAPQAFDEDLHLETVGGAARVNVLSDDLIVERSNSFTLSSDWAHHIGDWQGSFIAEGFYTRLNNPFINANPEELPNGISIITKRNGDAAYVAGTNLEWRVAVSRRLNFQFGLTIQDARYLQEEEIWEPDDIALEEQPGLAATVTDRILRAPNTYGFLATVWKPVARLAINVSGTYTGPMIVPHVTGPVLFPETNSETLFTYTELKETPSFFDLNLKVSYDFKVSKASNLQVFGGIQNMLNSYQRDFDRGAIRDAGYIFGPTRPITPFFGVKLFYL
jgi:outer membrane receptor for ferrienterochelin and colicins